MVNVDINALHIVLLCVINEIILLLFNGFQTIYQMFSKLYKIRKFAVVV